MSPSVYTADDIPISRHRQRELAENWQELSSEELQDRCREILLELPDGASKKRQIITLYLVLGDKESAPSHHLISEVIDTTKSYARRFNYLYNEQVVTNRDPMSSGLRDHVLDRDDNQCLNCGAEENLEIHHVIPSIEGGDSSLSNLATLCSDCHLKAHGGEWGEVNYDTPQEFWDSIEE